MSSFGLLSTDIDSLKRVHQNVGAEAHDAQGKAEKTAQLEEGSRETLQLSAST